MVVKWHQEGGSVVDGGKGGACSWSISASGTQEQGFVHPFAGASHSVGPGGGSLVMFTRLRAGDTGVGVMDVALMGVAVIPIFEPLD
jgi:hypothetical protein